MTEREAYGLPADDRLPRAVCIPVISVLGDGARPPEQPGCGAVPNPGSLEASEGGCLCPVIDNHYGRGFPYRGATDFWITADCPMHGFLPQPEPVSRPTSPNTDKSK